ncbi:hypothetical protein FRB95_011242 [Tulasnella sp. JGI-2019a]|nr:hypothetical protein FRB95_011242 [Tulasnella sp. JGI-2019a]
MFTIASAVALAFVSSALAQPGPLTPSPAIEGQPCQITWTPDATGKWTQTNIQLMTGDNNNMVPLTTVATVDTTSAAATTYSWICPDVTIYSAIYFYQFSHEEEPNNLIWTTRWAIESPSGEVVTPPNATQPGAAAGATPVPWGTGALKNPADGNPAPSYIVGQPGTADTTAATATNGTVATSAAVSVSSSVASVTMSTSAKSMTTAVAKNSTATSITSSASATATGTSSTSGAGLSRSHGSVLVAAVGAVVAGVFVLA